MRPLLWPVCPWMGPPEDTGSRGAVKASGCLCGQDGSASGDTFSRPGGTSGDPVGTLLCFPGSGPAGLLHNYSCWRGGWVPQSCTQMPLTSTWKRPWSLLVESPWALALVLAEGEASGWFPSRGPRAHTTPPSLLAPSWTREERELPRSGPARGIWALKAMLYSPQCPDPQLCSARARGLPETVAFRVGTHWPEDRSSTSSSPRLEPPASRPAGELPSPAGAPGFPSRGGHPDSPPLR